MWILVLYMPGALRGWDFLFERGLCWCGCHYTREGETKELGMRRLVAIAYTVFTEHVRSIEG